MAEVHEYDPKTRSVYSFEATPEYKRDTARRRVSGQGEADRAGTRRKRHDRVFAAAGSAAAPYAGKGMLTAELLAGFVIIAIRIVANYEVQEGGTVKGTVLHPKGEYGPLTVFAGLIMTFFVLSFFAASGGLKAKLAVIMGGSIILTLAVKSYDEIRTVSTTIGSIGKIAVPDPSGQQESVLGTAPAAPGTGPATPVTSNPVQTPSTAPHNPPGWVAVPGSGGGQVYAVNGRCPAGWARGGTICLAPLGSPVPA